MRDFVRAEPFTRRSLEISEKALGPWHPDTAKYSGQPGRCCTRRRAMPHGPSRFTSALLEITSRHVEAAAAALSERQQLAMNQMFRYRLDAFVQFLLARGGRDREAFAAVLGWKGATLVRQRAMRLAADEPELAPLFADLQRVARLWAALATGTPPLDQQDRWRERVATLEAEKERLEAELSRRSAAYRQATEKLTVDQLLKDLPADAALVDFLEFTKNLEFMKMDAAPAACPVEKGTLAGGLRGPAGPARADVRTGPRGPFERSDRHLAKDLRHVARRKSSGATAPAETLGTALGGPGGRQDGPRLARWRPGSPAARRTARKGARHVPHRGPPAGAHPRAAASAGPGE